MQFVKGRDGPSAEPGRMVARRGAWQWVRRERLSQPPSAGLAAGGPGAPDTACKPWRNNWARSSHNGPPRSGAAPALIALKAAGLSAQDRRDHRCAQPAAPPPGRTAEGRQGQRSRVTCLVLNSLKGHPIQQATSGWRQPLRPRQARNWGAIARAARPRLPKRLFWKAFNWA